MIPMREAHWRGKIYAIDGEPKTRLEAAADLLKSLRDDEDDPKVLKLPETVNVRDTIDDDWTAIVVYEI